MDGPDTPTWTERLCAAALCLMTALVLVGGLTPFGSATSPDSIRYIRVAKNVESGHGIVLGNPGPDGSGELRPFTTYPPLYPLVLSLFVEADEPGQRAAARLAVLTLFLSALLFFHLAYPATGYAGALLTTLIFCVSQPVLTVYIFAWSESLTIPLLLLAVWAGVACIGAVERSSTRHALWLGLLTATLIALASTRYIGVVFAVLIPLVWRRSGRLRTLRHVLAGSGVALACGLLYLRNYRLTGHFSGAVREASTNTLPDNLIDMADALYTQLAVGRGTWIAIGLLTLALVVWRWMRGAGEHDRDGVRVDHASRVTSLAWPTFLAYAALLAVIRSVKHLDEIDTRFVTPAFVLLLLVLVVQLGVGWQRIMASLRWAAIAGSILVLGLVAARGIEAHRDTAIGWATEGHPRFRLSSSGEYYDYTDTSGRGVSTAKLDLAEELLANGRHGEAVELLSTALSTSTDERYRIARDLALAHAELADVTASVRYTRECLRLDRLRAESDILKIVKPFFADRALHRSGIDYYEGLKPDAPFSWWIHANIGALARQLGDTELASKSLAIAKRLKNQRPVVLIVVDTLRADRLGLYGHDRPTTPNLDARAARARVFERAYATSSWTLPSFGSIYTGQLPMRHSAGLVKDSGIELVWDRLDPAVPTLAEILGARGYATCALVNNPYLGPAFGTERGFARFSYDPGLESEIRRADRIVDESLAWLSWRADTPFLQVVHLFDPHTPYDAPPPFGGSFSDAYDSRLERPLRHDDVPTTPQDLSEDDRDFVRAAYDEEIAFVDRELGRFLDELERRGIFDRALVVLTSDHGEELFEHGGFEHGHALWEGVQRIPLMVWGPGVRPGREPAPVSLTDLLPTVLEAVGVPAPPGLEGRSLWPNLSEGLPIPGRVLIAEGALYGAQIRIALRWPHKLHLDAQNRPVALFDLEADPDERLDILATQSAVAADLAREVSVRALAARRLRGRRADPE